MLIISLKWKKRTEPQKYEKAKREYLELIEGIGVTRTYIFKSYLFKRRLTLKQRILKIWKALICNSFRKIQTWD